MEHGGSAPEEIAPGLWSWARRHPEWHPGDFGAEVVSFIADAGDETLLDRPAARRGRRPGLGAARLDRARADPGPDHDHLPRAQRRGGPRPPRRRARGDDPRPPGRRQAARLRGRASTPFTAGDELPAGVTRPRDRQAAALRDAAAHPLPRRARLRRRRRRDRRRARGSGRPRRSTSGSAASTRSGSCRRSSRCSSSTSTGCCSPTARRSSSGGKDGPARGDRRAALVPPRLSARRLSPRLGVVLGVVVGVEALRRDLLQLAGSRA